LSILTSLGQFGQFRASLGPFLPFLAGNPGRSSSPLSGVS